MRWPCGPPHLTLKPSKNRKKNKPPKRKKQSKNTPKNELFNYQPKVVFWWGSQISLFLTTWPKNAHPKNTIKIRVSAKHFVGNRFASRNGHFWTKEPIPEIPVTIFGVFFSCSNKKHNKLLKPQFYSVLANIKKFKFKLKTEKFGHVFAPCFRKWLFLENCPNWAQKAQNDNWLFKKSLETTINIGPKSPWTRQSPLLGPDNIF